MKAFLTDYGRIKMAKLALEYIDNVIRIQTDSITYDKHLKINMDVLRLKIRVFGLSLNRIK